MSQIESKQTIATAKGEKLQKILARAGFGSRREVEKIIAEGLVKINGRTAQLGDRAFTTDNLQFKGQLIKETRLAKQATQVILYNKPEGLVCSRKDEKDRQTIFAKLPRIINGRWVSVGRLDINTSGLLILTNNGELANRMMHPSYQIEREYSVRIFGEVTDEMINTLKKGVKLNDGFAKFDKLSKLPKQDDDNINKWYKVVIKEGRNREVRRIWETQGLQVSRLIRTRYGDFDLPRNLRQEKSIPLDWKQINQLLKSVGMRQEERPDLRYSASLNDKKPFTKAKLYKKANSKPTLQSSKNINDSDSKKPNKPKQKPRINKIKRTRT